MSMKKSAVQFVDSPEQREALDAVIEKYRETEGALMPVMQQAQGIYGYLPYEVMKVISEKMDVSLSEIYGVATFYSQFNLNPKGKYKISVCLGTACYVKNAGGVFDRLERVLGVSNGECTSDGVFSLDATRCLGCCGLAPVMMINEDVYGRLTPSQVSAILDMYK